MEERVIQTLSMLYLLTLRNFTVMFNGRTRLGCMKRILHKISSAMGVEDSSKKVGTKHKNQTNKNKNQKTVLSSKLKKSGL
jgi:PBP1b-binding outer membrane lipoprotein LpoB